MKPFNLQEALAGKPVVDSTGSPVTDFHYFANSTEKQKLYGISLQGEVLGYSDNGQFYAGGQETLLDLFMASEKKEGWVNLYTENGVTNMTGNIYRCEEHAQHCKAGNFVATVRIEWEE